MPSISDGGAGPSNSSQDGAAWSPEPDQQKQGRKHFSIRVFPSFYKSIKTCEKSENLCKRCQSLKMKVGDESSEEILVKVTSRECKGKAKADGR